MQLEIGKKYSWLDGIEIWEYVGKTLNGVYIFKTDNPEGWIEADPRFDVLESGLPLPKNSFGFSPNEDGSFDDLGLTPYEDTNNPSS